MAASAWSSTSPRLSAWRWGLSLVEDVEVQGDAIRKIAAVSWEIKGE
jgi:hypothetical protein